MKFCPVDILALNRFAPFDLVPVDQVVDVAKQNAANSILELE